MLMAAGADIHGKGRSLQLRFSSSMATHFCFSFLVSLVTGRRGYTPLHFAALRGHNAVVDFLLGKLRSEDNVAQTRNRSNYGVLRSEQCCDHIVRAFELARQFADNVS